MADWSPEHRLPIIQSDLVAVPGFNDAEQARIEELIEKDWASLDQKDTILIDKYLSYATSLAREQSSDSNPKHARAMVAIAGLHERRGTQKNLAISLSLNRLAASLGEAHAAYNLGRIHAGGLFGVPQNVSKAKDWFEKSASMGDLPDAFYALGHLYHHSLGVLNSRLEMAKRWYLMASDFNHLDAQASLCDLLFSNPGQPPDYKEARKWCLRASKSSPLNARVQLALGSMYYNGYGGKREANLGFEWLKSAADQGLQDAQFRVGLAYSSGVGESVSPNETQARFWYRLAAEQGHKHAQYNLAGMLRDGLGGNGDINHALYWYQHAAEQGDHDAEFAIASLYYNADTPTMDDAEKSYQWMLRAAKGGHADAMYWLAMLLAEGHGVEKSENGARQWLDKAARMGHFNSEKKLREISSESEILAREFSLFNEFRVRGSYENTMEPEAIDVDSGIPSEESEDTLLDVAYDKEDLDDIFYEEL